MTLRLRRTQNAAQDLRAIWQYIADQNPQSADKHNSELEKKFLLLASMPELGMRVPEFAPDLRGFSAGNYVIFYRFDERTLTIVRVLHAACDIASLFRGS